MLPRTTQVRDPMQASRDRQMSQLLSAWAEDIVARRQQQAADRSREEKQADRTQYEREEKRDARLENAEEQAAVRKRQAAGVRKTQHKRRDIQAKGKRTQQTRDVFVRKQEALDQARQRAKDAKVHGESAQRAADQALGHSVSSYLQGLVAQAESNDASAVTIPTGIRVASTTISGPPLGEIEALIADVQGEVREGKSDSPTQRARQSAAWALGHGLMPHPGDIARLLGGQGNKGWAKQFGETGRKLDRFAEAGVGNAHLRALNAGERLDVMDGYCSLLAQYGADRLMDLVSGKKHEPPPPPDPKQSGMRRAELDSVLDQLFS